MMDNEISIDLFIDIFIGYTKNKDNGALGLYESIKENLMTLSTLSNLCKEYSDISKYIYNLSEEDFKLLKNFFDIGDEKKGSYNGILEDLKELSVDQKDNLKRFERHVKLSCHQRDYIVNNFTKVSDELKNVKGEIKDTENKVGNLTSNVSKASDEMGKNRKDFDKITEKVKQAKSKVNGIYSEFVGILGVFTALSFALMGSVQVFGNILKNINTPNVGNIGYVLVVGGVYLLLIYLVIMTLFIGMKKVFKEGSEYQFNRAFTWRIIGTSAVLVLSGLGLIVIHEFCLT
ncbi:hypothetical protein [Ligilactobacillus salivarius]|nr:hypothetical protein [Ligilactobacillus salivarius]